MGLSDSSQVSQRYISDTFADEHISLSDQIERLLEWNLDVVRGVRSITILLLGQGKGDIALAVLPLSIGLLH